MESWSPSSSNKIIKLENKKLDSNNIMQKCGIGYRDYGLLRPGSKLVGYQKNNDDIKYDVEINIIDIDFDKSFICGEFKIRGIINYMEYITTYFEGEIINKEQNFSSKHLGVDFDTDCEHWCKFEEFKEFYNNLVDKKNNKNNNEVWVDNFIFMRWKEQHFTHNYKIRNMNGVDIDGFYYICFNKLKEKITGYYYGDSINKFQKIYLEFDINNYLKKGSENFDLR
jgi:hypothetical protein